MLGVGCRRSVPTRRTTRALESHAGTAAHVQPTSDSDSRLHHVTSRFISRHVRSAALDEAGELVRVTQPVAAHLELCEIADRVMKQPGGGPALLFEHVDAATTARGRAIPVAINLFGSMSRMAHALGVETLDDIGRPHHQAAWTSRCRTASSGSCRLLPRLLEVAKFPPRMQTRRRRRARRSSGAATRSICDKLPIITCWPEDGGPYITLPDGDLADPKRGIRNVGMYRVQVLGTAHRSRCTGSGTRSARRTGARWRSGARRCRSCIAIGADPASMYSASRAAAADGRRVHLRRLSAQSAGAAGEGGHLRSRGAGRRRVRDRGLHRSRGGARDRGAVRRPHRLLLGGGPVPAGARHRDHDAAQPGLCRRRSSAVRRWRTSTSATRPSGSSCRCSS